MKLSFKRVGAVTGAVAASAGALLVAGSGLNPAAASTIPTGELQICAQGDYSAFIQPVASATSRENQTAATPARQSLANEIVSPGHCFVLPFDTYGQWARVEVTGVRPDGSQFSLGSQWYNSSVSGLGIGAEGSWSTGPFVWTW
ncbi:hypothetical protein [Actinoallomurus sp. NPDC050550]|uniref:hypothetical protein n=1 Tax=Actinoallomurus sp. NPDC050550 TaxID=3154937 RepID=UPI00340B030A